ncbi:HlyD family secretion protein [Alkalitalea saponilacus]|uniref:HlyD family secretion protein n=1 Tax=Alkalitalea saponilacus TaxID=889453 RepID=A0A1T5HU34_9BACT|nr:HlyD family efflux transporter periplasmic adaptor subunit [Alkalitalea saponilacus]ASB49310.1 hypothetical protein CDL62_09230 [Alkalitalea saponilacus]SKC24061.1 HlyD family secretion protein [Alkalitalea saponilacus]
MSKENLFPPEIIEYTVENHFSENNKRFRLIYVGIVVAVMVAIIMLPLVKITVSTPARGIIRTQFENINIQASIHGQVDFSDIHEGQHVQAGDTLLVLRTDRINEQINHAIAQKKENKEFIRDLDVLLSGDFNVGSPKYKQEAFQHLAKLEEMNVAFEMVEKEYELAQHLFQEKVTAKMEYLQVKNQYELFQSQLTLFQKQTRNSWESEKTRIARENTQLKSNIRQLREEMTQFIITAPASGVLSKTIGVQAGSFVNPGQIIAQISPDDELIVECYISPKDIGFIYPGQMVRIQVDAFNYNQWGLIIGDVIHVSEDIISLENNPVFRVRCRIHQNYLELKSGHRGYIKKGMTVTGRFDLTRRSLFHLLFDKVDNWLNPQIQNI